MRSNIGQFNKNVWNPNAYHHIAMDPKKVPPGRHGHSWKINWKVWPIYCLLHNQNGSKPEALLEDFLAIIPTTCQPVCNLLTYHLHCKREKTGRKRGENKTHYRPFNMQLHCNTYYLHLIFEEYLAMLSQDILIL